MNKITTLTLISLVVITSVSNLAFAETKTDTSIGMFQTTQVSPAVLSGIPIPEKPPSGIVQGPSIPEPIPPIPIESRYYTGEAKLFFKNSGNKDIQKGTASVWVEKMYNKDLFRIRVEMCFKSDSMGWCTISPWSDWFEGKVSGKNWIIKYKTDSYSLNGVFGKQGHLTVDSTYAKLEMKLTWY